jgi:indolepyruvate ferredoxin oxidoreductase beta subunit
MKHKMTNILLVGVGGQGTLLASRILGNLLLNEGYDVKVSEVHGMSQRGGSVVTYVRYGDKVNSPLVAKGEADIILAFEQLEALRWAEYLKPNGRLIMNTQQIDPMPVINGTAEYPKEIYNKLLKASINVTQIDALSKATEAGSSKAVNIVLLGVLAKQSEIPKEKWIEVIKNTVPPKFLDINIIAFELGMNS